MPDFYSILLTSFSISTPMPYSLHYNFYSSFSYVLKHLVLPFQEALGYSSCRHLHKILLPGKFHGLRSLVGYSPWGRKESDTTERLHFTSLPPNILL